MRRTGKTFRALLDSLKQASEGSNVVYECPTHNMARWTFEKAATVTALFMEPETPEKLVLKIGTGSVRFVSKLNDKERRSVIASGKYKVVHDDIVRNETLELNYWSHRE